MSKRHHVRLWILATGVWAGFLALGLPDYYQQYSPSVMLGFEVALVLPFSIVLYVVLKRAPARRRMSLARWIAFYFTVPLAVYDYLYCGLVLGRLPWQRWPAFPITPLAVPRETSRLWYSPQGDRYPR